MTELDGLLTLSGVVAVGEFSPEGKLLNYKTKVGWLPGAAKMSGEFYSKVTAMFNELSKAFGEASHMKLTPSHGWAYCGGDWTIIASGNRAIYAESHKVDVNHILKVLLAHEMAVTDHVTSDRIAFQHHAV